MPGSATWEDVASKAAIPGSWEGAMTMPEAKDVALEGMSADDRDNVDYGWGQVYGRQALLNMSEADVRKLDESLWPDDEGKQISRKTPVGELRNDWKTVRAAGQQVRNNATPAVRVAHDKAFQNADFTPQRSNDEPAPGTDPLTGEPIGAGQGILNAGARGVEKGAIGSIGKAETFVANSLQSVADWWNDVGDKGTGGQVIVDPERSAISRFANRMSEGQQAFEQTLPGSQAAARDPFSVSGVAEGATEGITSTAVQLALTGGFGKAAEVGELATAKTLQLGGTASAAAQRAGQITFFGQMAGDVAESNRQQAYDAYIKQGVDPATANQKAAGVGIVAAAIATYLNAKMGVAGKIMGTQEAGAVNSRLEKVAESIGGQLLAGRGTDLSEQLIQYATTGKQPDGERFAAGAVNDALMGTVFGTAHALGEEGGKSPKEPQPAVGASQAPGREAPTRETWESVAAKSNLQATREQIAGQEAQRDAHADELNRLTREAQRDQEQSPVGVGQERGGAGGAGTGETAGVDQGGRGEGPAGASDATAAASPEAAQPGTQGHVEQLPADEAGRELDEAQKVTPADAQATLPAQGETHGQSDADHVRARPGGSSGQPAARPESTGDGGQSRPEGPARKQAVDAIRGALAEHFPGAEVVDHPTLGLIVKTKGGEVVNWELHDTDSLGWTHATQAHLDSIHAHLEENGRPASFKTSTGREVTIPKTAHEWDALPPAQKKAIKQRFVQLGHVDLDTGTIHTTHAVANEPAIATEEMFHRMARSLNKASRELYQAMIAEYGNEENAARAYMEAANKREFFDHIREQKTKEPETVEKRTKAQMPERKTPKSTREVEDDKLIEAAKEQGALMGDIEREAMTHDDEGGIHPDSIEDLRKRDEASHLIRVDEKGKEIPNDAHGKPTRQPVDNTWRSYGWDAEGNKLIKAGAVNADSALSEAEQHRLIEDILMNKEERLQRAAEHFHHDQAPEDLRDIAERVLGKKVPMEEVPFAMREEEKSNTAGQGSLLGEAFEGSNIGSKTGSLFGDTRQPAKPEEEAKPTGADAKIAKKFANTQSGRLFAMREADNERDLIVLHNLTSGHVEAADKLGGIPLPSMAITKTGIPFSQYGEITLVGDRAMIDPANPQNHVHDADLYSQRMPEQQWKVKAGELAKFRKGWPEAPEVKKYTKTGDYENPWYISEWLNQGFSGAEREAKNSTPFMVQFAREHNLELPKAPDFNGNYEHDRHEQWVVREALRDMINAHGREKFDAWVEQEVGKLKGDAFFENRRGNKRPFTLENLVDDMRRRSSAGKEQSTMTKGLGLARAVGSKKFKSIEQIRAAKGTLATAEEVKAAQEQARNNFTAVAHGLSDGWPYDLKAVGATWDMLDATGEAVGKYLKGGMKSPRSILRSVGFAKAEAIPDNAIKDFEKLAHDVKNAPTDYFEAKPQRGVQLANFRGAVIPSDTPAEARAILAKHGLPIEEYARGDNEARRQAVERLAKAQDKPDSPVLFAMREKADGLAQEHGGPNPTGLSYATVNAERAARGLPEAARSGRSWEVDDNLAHTEILRDPKAPEKLVDELVASPRPTQSWENAMLTMHKTDLHEAFDKAVAAKDSTKQADILARLDRLEKATLSGGSSSELGLGLSSLQRLMNRDYSAAELVTKMTQAKGRKLTDEETQGLMKQAEEHKAKIAALEAHIKDLEEKAQAKAVAEAGDKLIKEVAATSRMIAKGKADPNKRQAILDRIKMLTGGGARFSMREKPAESARATSPDDQAATGPIEEPTEGQIATALRELARWHVENGLRDREELFNAVHNDTPDLKMTRREKMDAITGYGKFRQLSKDEISTELRRMSGEAQQVAKLEDMAKGQPPRKTGVERRTPSDEERRLIQQVNEAKKRLGVNVTDPETQLKSALQSQKTRLTNEIADLEHQISTRQQTVKTRTAAPEDAETKALKARRDALREDYRRIFDDPHKNDASRLRAAEAAAERSAAEAERRVKEAEIFQAKRLAPKNSAVIEAAKARRDAANSQLAELRANSLAWRETQRQKAAAATIDRLTKSIEKAQGKIAQPESLRKTQGPAPADTPEVAALKGHLGKLQGRVAELRKAQNPVAKASPEDVAFKATMSRLRNRMAALAERLATNDFGPPAPKEQKPIDPRTERLRADVKEVEQAVEAAERKARLERRPGWMKATDALASFGRASILSSPRVLEKLSSFAMARMVVNPFVEAYGGILSKLPGLRDIAAKAPREGQFSPRAEAAAWKTFFTTGLREAVRAARTGKTTADTIYGDHEHELTGLAHFLMETPGRIHKALKTPVAEAERTRATIKRQAAGQSPEEAAQAAYVDSKRAISMQDNVLAAKLSTLKTARAQAGSELPSTGEHLASTAANILLPITKVPFNLAAETMNYAFGSLIGATKAGLAIRRGIDNLKPEEADVIMRHLKQGGIGLAAYALGMALHGQGVFGGLYQNDQKKKEGDVPFGAIRIGGHDMPETLTEHPLFRAMQMGATHARVAEDYQNWNAEQDNPASPAAAWWAGHVKGAFNATADSLMQTPIFRESLDLQKFADANTRQQALAQRVEALIVPMIVQDIAKATDSEEKRQPSTFLEQLEMGIPGLRQLVPAKERHRSSR